METVSETIRDGLEVVDLYALIGNSIDSFNTIFSSIEAENRGKILGYLNGETAQEVPESNDEKYKIYVIDNNTNTCYLTARKNCSKSFISFKNFDFEFAKNCLAEVLRAIIKYIPTHKRTRELTGILLQIQPPKSTQ